MIDEILEALDDGKWHNLFEILDTANMIAGYKQHHINHKQLRKTLIFLEKFEFVEKKTSASLWRIVPSVQRFLEEIRKLELEELEATV